MVGADIICEYCGYVTFWNDFNSHHDYENCTPYNAKGIRLKKYDNHRRRINEKGQLLELEGHNQHDAPHKEQLDAITRFVDSIESSNVKFFKSKWNSGVTIIPNFPRRFLWLNNKRTFYVLTKYGFSNYYDRDVREKLTNEYSIEITKSEALHLISKFFEKFELIDELNPVKTKLLMIKEKQKV